jgi:hypothetical protein
VSKAYVAAWVILPGLNRIQTALGTGFAMFQDMARHLSARAEKFLAGQLVEMLKDYTTPMPVYLGDHRMVVGGPDQALTMLSFLRDAMLARGVVALRPTVKAIDLPRGGRFRAWVDWHEIAYPPSASRWSTVTYYCRQTHHGPQTEMMHYTRQSMPELAQRFAALARSA